MRERENSESPSEKLLSLSPSLSIRSPLFFPSSPRLVSAFRSCSLSLEASLLCSSLVTSERERAEVEKSAGKSVLSLLPVGIGLLRRRRSPSSTEQHCRVSLSLNTP